MNNGHHFFLVIQVTANDLIGNTIDCISANIPGNVLNTYCWIMSTFSVPGKTSIASATQCYDYYFRRISSIFQFRVIPRLPV
jgi:hypothetical protein